MYSIFKKEITSFWSSLIAYIVIGVFLLATGLFLWVFPEFNILDFGYANLDGLFSMSPWLFMFLIPAVTMRSFSEEKNSGTIELLLTKPITDLQIVLGKFFAGVVLVFFALLPTLFYYFTVYKLADPVGNLDSGAIIGSYVGLFFLAGAYVAIGLFASSLTKNQIVSFILAVFLCFFFYAAFSSLSSLGISNKVILFLEELSISTHYVSISKGVLDTRDLIYFISLIVLFILFTKTVLNSRKW